MTQLTRRTLMTGAAAAAVLGTSAGSSTTHAAAPMSGKQAPGFYRYKIGEFEITALHDGMVRQANPTTWVVNQPFPEVQKVLAAASLPTDAVLNPFTALLVNTGRNLVLIDSGFGDNGAPTVGNMLGNMAAAGIDPKTIDTILVSHFHGDHISGIRAKAGAANYPNAEIMIPQAEWTYWTNDSELAKAAQVWKGAFANVKRVFDPIAKDVKRFEYGKELVPGITAVDARGHSPGHTAFVIASGNAKLLVLSDTSNNPAVFVRNPEWHCGPTWIPPWRSRRASGCSTWLPQTACRSRHITSPSRPPDSSASKGTVTSTIPRRGSRCCELSCRSPDGAAATSGILASNGKTPAFAAAQAGLRAHQHREECTMKVDRRTVLAGAATAIAGAPFAASLAPPARAAAPAAGKQAPGFYRHKVGDFEVTIISDGAVEVQPPAVRNATPEQVKAALQAAYLPTDKYWNQFNPVLVNTGSKLVLLDAGNNVARSATTARLTAGLAAAGVDPKAIDVIVISHFHQDHIGGLRDKDNALVYPNAEIMVPEPEWAFWMDDGNMSRAQPGTGVANTFQNVRRIFGPIADKVTKYAPGKEVVPGITTLFTPGHTPGHTSFVVASGNGRLVVQADVTGNPAINLRNPGWHAPADMDGPAAEAARRKLYDMVASERTLISGYHYPFPAVGYAEKDGANYRLVPLAWSPVL